MTKEITQSLASAIEQQGLYERAVRRVSADPEAYGGISLEEAISNGLVSRDELTAPDKELWAEAEIGWIADDELARE